MEINISVNHKSKPKLINNFYRHSIKQKNYICEKERERQVNEVHRINKARMRKIIENKDSHHLSSSQKLQCTFTLTGTK